MIDKPVQRRAFLRGAGSVVLGLPWLDAFAAPQVRASEATPPQFIVIMHQANGVAQETEREPERFWPSEPGPITSASLRAEPERAVAELADHADRLLMLRGLRYGFDGLACAHVDAFCQLLTASEPWQDESTRKVTAMGESIDHRLASALNPAGREPLTLLAPCNVVMAPTMSFRGPKQPRSVDSNPWTVYKRVFGFSAANQALAELIMRRRKSVNDLVRSQLKQLLARKDLSRDDRRRLDLHLSSVRDVELRLSCEVGSLPGDELDDVALRDSRNLEAVAKLHMDLIAISCACDYSRVATLSIGGCGNAVQLQLPGFPSGNDLPNYHQISHRVYNDGRAADVITTAQDMHHAYDRLHARFFGYLLDKLADYSAPNGSLLDHGIAVWANELGDGPQHARKNMPWIIAGSAAGYLRQGAFIDVDDVTHNRLLNTLLNAMGVRKSDGSLVDDFGDPRLDRGQLDAALARA